ncbi:MAG: toprim domain-containing protein [Proteobacteria bacterium]|nr:toprim domain-containing protein [Pseudomonadota bacterium]MBU4576017.1 toprim domain-containing protein [Pseudomonadota bacterium]MBV1715983.1 toprim domain-containing protein [Desulfarculus sp.]
MAKDLIERGDYMPLSKRGISQATAAKFDYSVSRMPKDDPHGHAGQVCQVAHYRNQQGQVCAQHIRFPDKDFIWRGKAKGVQLFGQHIWRTGGRRVIVTEGEIDAMSVSQLQGNKYPVVSIPSGAKGAKKAFQDNMEWLETFESVVICFDMDEPGQDAARDCALLLTPGRAKIAHLPLKDANEMLLADRGDELMRALWDAKPYRPDGIISGRDLRERVKKEPVPGFTVPYPELQEKTMGVRPGEIWLFTAGSGIGKSTLVQELAYDLAMTHGQTVGVLALEENVERTGQRYIGIHLNKPIHLTREGVTDEDIDRAFDETLDTDRWWFYEHFGSSEIDNLLSKIRYMIVGLGCKFIILDHISIVVSGLDEDDGNERKTIDKLMTKLRSLVEETGAGCLAIVHLKRPGGTGKSWNEGRIPTLTDLRGSGGLEQLSDIVVAGYRDQTSNSEQDVMGLRVLKNRPVGKTGDAGKARYYHDTGRLLAYEDCPFGDESDGAEGEDF